jgi:pyridoxal phosphate phosphatase PHOSPHO2
VLLCRRYRGLEQRIAREDAKAEELLAAGEARTGVALGGLKLQCSVKYWAGAWEVEELLGELGVPMS